MRVACSTARLDVNNEHQVRDSYPSIGSRFPQLCFVLPDGIDEPSRWECEAQHSSVERERPDRSKPCIKRVRVRSFTAVAFAGWLGPRVSEVFGLQWQDLDLLDGVVTFRRGVVQGRITPLKTEASRTDLTIPSTVLHLLRQWREASIFKADTDWVFASPFNKGAFPYWPSQLMKTHIVAVARKAGLPHIGWHSFSHTVSGCGQSGWARARRGEGTSTAREPVDDVAGLRTARAGSEAPSAAAAH